MCAHCASAAKPYYSSFTISCCVYSICITHHFNLSPLTTLLLISLLSTSILVYTFFTSNRIFHSYTSTHDSSSIPSFTFSTIRSSSNISSSVPARCGSGNIYVRSRCFLYIFLAGYRVCWPLLCLCRPFCICERCLKFEPLESCPSKQARYQLSHPSP